MTQQEKIKFLSSLSTEQEARQDFKLWIREQEKKMAQIGREIGLKNGWAAIAKTRKDKGISKKVLDYFGYEKITMYRKKENVS